MSADTGTGASVRTPRVLLPYAGPDTGGAFTDIFVYLRPEANGVLAESAILKVIERCSAYKKDLFLVYMANIPGDFIACHKLVEKHYAVKLVFAVRGGDAFTPEMRIAFERYFRERFDAAKPIGAFQAMDDLNLRAEELFSVRVPESEVLMVNGQSIKKVRGRYIVNYDIPALLHKNNAHTDIAVMLFRTRNGYHHFSELIREMKDAVVREGIIGPGQHFSRVFHYSKSPFEQALDARSHLFGSDGAFLGLEASSFAEYCMVRGLAAEQLHGLVDNPVCTFHTDDGPVEEHLSTFTEHDDYATALDKAKRITAQAWLVK